MGKLATEKLCAYIDLIDEQTFAYFVSLTNKYGDEYIEHIENVTTEYAIRQADIFISRNSESLAQNGELTAVFQHLAYRMAKQSHDGHRFSEELHKKLTLIFASEKQDEEKEPTM